MKTIRNSFDLYMMFFSFHWDGMDLHRGYGGHVT